ncbi:MAG: response regulator transcription factor [Eubacterium sp.]|nr:response regulator transcription factor [Eubacterium sp.]
MALIYVVEDDVNIQEIEMFALKNSGYRVEGFGNAKDFFAKLSEKTPDLILLDVMLPDLDGLSILKKVRTVPDTKKIPVIFVSAKTSEIDKVKGLDMGADDYLAKPFGVMELISRVKALLRRSNAASEEKTLTLGEIQIDNEKHCVYVGNRLCELTYKEFELLKMMLQNVGIVLTRDRIMDRVWGTDYEGESRTLDMHIKTLRKKLGEEGTRIKTVRNVGYVLE